jgi:hypothetical protein
MTIASLDTEEEESLAEKMKTSSRAPPPAGHQSNSIIKIIAIYRSLHFIVSIESSSLSFAQIQLPKNFAQNISSNFDIIPPTHTSFTIKIQGWSQLLCQSSLDLISPPSIFF